MPGPRHARATSRRAWALAGVVAALSVAHVARADPEPPGAPAPHTLTPPRAVFAGVVPYPPRGSGESTVTVELTVDADGAVADVRLVEGAAPFTAATMQAAWRWRFEPARRDGAPVAARVRMRVAFTPPVTLPSTPVAGTLPVATEVTVTGHRRDPGQTTLGKGEARQLPGAFGDAFRAVEALPGATPMASGLPYFFIRGAPPGDTGYFIDGVRVPLLFHAAFGPSVIHPSLVDHVDFFPGGAPVQFGRSVGGILSATMPEPSPTPHAEGIVRAFDAGALAETPLANGRGTVLAAGRYSYSGAILSLVSPLKLQYWDYQARATWKIDDRTRIGVLAFGSYDDFGQVRSGVTDTIIDGQFHRVDVRLDHALEHGSVRVAATLGYGRSSNNDNDIRDLGAGVRVALEDRVSDALGVRAGADVTLDRFDLLADTEPNPAARVATSLLYPPHVDVAASAYADITWKLGRHLVLVPGLRADLFLSHRSDSPVVLYRVAPSATVTSVLPAVDPRLAAQLEITRRVSFLSTVGVMHQPPAFLVPIPGLSFVELNPVLQTSVQISEGLAVALPGDFTVQATGFLHTYLDLTDLTATCPSVFGAGVLLGNAPGILNESCLAEHVRGRAFGGELTLRRSITERLTGWLSYTLSRSTREAFVPGAPTTAPVDILAAFDRTHVVNVVVSYDLGSGWQAGGRLVAYSGLPYSATRSYVPVPPYNGERMPAFYRVDLRLEKRFQLSARATLALVFEGMNVTLNKEALGAHCAPAPGVSAASLDWCSFQTLGPVSVPSVGLEGIFR